MRTFLLKTNSLPFNESVIVDSVSLIIVSVSLSLKMSIIAGLNDKIELSSCDSLMKGLDIFRLLIVSITIALLRAIVRLVCL